MKRNTIVLVHIIYLLLLCNCDAQVSKDSYIYFPEYSFDLNLYSPSNEFYLFSAYDEGANAFRYNPAVLGLSHKFNFSLGFFIEKYKDRVRFEETDIMLNTGILGLAYRGAAVHDQYGYRRGLHALSLGLGFGNKSFSGGLLGEYFIQDENVRADEFGAYSPRVTGSVGFHRL